MGLRLKFNLVMLAACLFGLAVAALFADQITESTARSEVLQEASLIMEQASAVRSYTSAEVAPLLADQNAVRFLPHTVPSFAAQSVVRTIERDFPNYDYKEAALNPTNPADRATDWEADIIDQFRRNAKLTELVGERGTEEGRILNFARPFKITDGACLVCHSTPAAAPAPMIDLYGPSNGFGWQLGETIGAQIVSVPMAVPLGRAHRELRALLGSLVVAFLVMLLLVNVLLHMVVIRPLERMRHSAQQVAGGALDEPEFVVKGHDEIASLGRSFNLMRRSLINAMKLLES